MEMFHRSDKQSNLMLAIGNVQMAVGIIGKEKFNPHFKSQYAPLDVIWLRATEKCADSSLVVVQPATGNGVWTYIFHTPSGEWMASFMELPLVAPASKDKETGEWRPGPVTPQVIGSITSYARRYSYLAALGLVAGEEDDDGNVSSGLEPKAEPKADPKAGLVARKGAAIASITEWLAGKTVIASITDGGLTEAKVLEALGDILGRPMDNMTLKDENELVVLEDWVKHLQQDTNEAKASPTKKGK